MLNLNTLEAIMEVEEILSQLIKIPSVNPPGGETPVAEFLKNLFDKAGIKNEIIEAVPGRGNFIASLGSGPKSLLFLAHEDVVPTGEGWDFDPFGGEIKNGYVYGRGALDCKGLVAAEALAMLHLQKLDLDGRLIFAATADEEAGGKDGVKFLLEKHPDKLLADFAINEGGEEPIEINGNPAYFIQLGEKGTSWTRLKFAGVSCHGALPTLGENAVVKASQAVVRLAAYKPEIKIIPEIKALLAKLGWQDGSKKTLDAFLDSYPHRPFAEALRSLTRMTTSPNIIHGGTKGNIVPDDCEVQVDIRVLPGQTKEYVIKTLRSIIGDDVDIDIRTFNAPSFSPMNSPYYGLIEQTMKETFGSIDCLPLVSAGATDSRFLRLNGIPSYGPTLAAPDIDPDIRMAYHAKNEHVDIKSLRLKVDFLVKLALNYLGKR